jgi:hypothetical protein
MGHGYASRCVYKLQSHHPKHTQEIGTALRSPLRIYARPTRAHTVRRKGHTPHLARQRRQRPWAAPSGHHPVAAWAVVQRCWQLVQRHCHDRGIVARPSDHLLWHHRPQPLPLQLACAGPGAMAGWGTWWRPHPRRAALATRARSPHAHGSARGRCQPSRHRHPHQHPPARCCLSSLLVHHRLLAVRVQRLGKASRQHPRGRPWGTQTLQ